MRWHPGNPVSMKRPDLADITVRNTTVGRSHGKLEPMETPSGVTAAWAFLGFCMVLVAVSIIVAWEYRDLWKDLVG